MVRLSQVLLRTSHVAEVHIGRTELPTPRVAAPQSGGSTKGPAKGSHKAIMGLIDSPMFDYVVLANPAMVLCRFSIPPLRLSRKK